MKKTVIVISLVALGVVGYWTVQQLLETEPAICEVCARTIHPGQEFTLVLNDGREEHTCCPRCGMHFSRSNPDQVRVAWASDHATGEKVAAKEAIYVEGSDLMNCCSTPPLQRDRETTYQMMWDRCLPSLIAFKSGIDAERFQQQHGGNRLSYADAVESVRMR